MLLGAPRQAFPVRSIAISAPECQRAVGVYTYGQPRAFVSPGRRPEMKTTPGETGRCLERHKEGEGNQDRRRRANRPSPARARTPVAGAGTTSMQTMTAFSM